MFHVYQALRNYTKQRRLYVVSQNKFNPGNGNKYVHKNMQTILEFLKLYTFEHFPTYKFPTIKRNECEKIKVIKIREQFR